MRLTKLPSILTPWGRASWQHEIPESDQVVFLTCDSNEHATSPSQAICFLHMLGSNYHGRVWAGSSGDLNIGRDIRGLRKEGTAMMQHVCRALIDVNNFSLPEQLAYADRMFILDDSQESDK